MAPLCYRRHRSQPRPSIYVRFTPSYRDVEELLAERGLDLSYERSRDSFARGRATAGILTRWWCGSPVSGCISGVRSTTRARSSTC